MRRLDDHRHRSARPRGATTAEISPADLRNRISIFADDSMQGRRTGTPGNVKGNAYIVGELRRLGLKPAGDTGGYLQKVPLSSYAADSARATLQVGSSELVLWQDYYPYQAEFEVPARPINGASLVYIGGPSDSAALPPREALQGKVVVYNSGASGNSLGAPDLHPAGRLGLISGIAVTGMDTADRHLRAGLPHAADRGQGGRRRTARRHPAPPAHPALGQRSRSSSASRSTSSVPATPAPPSRAT